LSFEENVAVLTPDALLAITRVLQAYLPSLYTTAHKNKTNLIVAVQ
jgi:hypothetical protein